MATATQRRSRFRPQPKDIRASNAPATLDVLDRLQDYRYSTTPVLAALTGYNADYLRHQVMPTLFNEGYVFVPEEATFSYNKFNRPRIVALSPKGETHLKDYGRYRATGIKTKEAFRHKFAGELTRASLEIASKEVPHLTFLTGQTLLNSPRCPETTREADQPFRIPLAKRILIPDDDLHGYKYAPPGSQPRFLFWLREDDRDTEDWATIRHKFENYLEVQRDHLYQTRYGIPNCLFLWVTINETRRQGMIRELLKLTKGKGSPQFLFKVINDFASYDHLPPATGHMASESWLRAGHEPLNLLKELGVVETQRAA